MDETDDLVAHTTSENPNIISITDTWLNTGDKHFLSEVSAPGYNMLSCVENRKGGGAILHYKRHDQCHRNPGSKQTSVRVRTDVFRSKLTESVI